MKYLNLGCGNKYSIDTEWVNIDFKSQSPNVLEYNLLKGIPYENDIFDVIYHSHVLEHFSKKDGSAFLKECYRTLKPRGILRIAVPDLEQIAKLYLRCLDEGVGSPSDPVIMANYNWAMLEMYDQSVRNYSGGAMAEYLLQKELINQDFVFERIGEEAQAIRSVLNKDEQRINRTKKILPFITHKFNRLKNLLSVKRPDTHAIGKFRLSGEVHQWMYDRYSLSRELLGAGFKEISLQTACSSHIPNWGKYQLDVENGITRKPDSLFMEAIK